MFASRFIVCEKFIGGRRLGREVEGRCGEDRGQRRRARKVI